MAVKRGLLRDTKKYVEYQDVLRNSPRVLTRLMVEETHTRKCHCNTVLVAGFNNIVVTDRAAGLCNKGYAASLCSVDVVAEGEEGI